jgi:hypothetical protein
LIRNLDNPNYLIPGACASKKIALIQHRAHLDTVLNCMTKVGPNGGFDGLDPERRDY